MTKYEIYVPTYNRQLPAITQMLDDDTSLHIKFCIRDEVDEHFYDELKKKYSSQVEFINLGTDIEDLGETRKRILSIAEKETQYCVMLDDSLTNITDKIHPEKSIHETIESAIQFLEEKMDKNTFVFCYTFYRDGNQFLGVTPTDEYFVGFPLQACIISTLHTRAFGLNYHTMKLVGLEDIAFFIDSVKHGLICVSNQDIVIDGKGPNSFLKGGSHNESIQEFIEMRDLQHKRLMRYIGNMYGIMLTKMYHKRLGFPLTYARIDFSYFREVLVYNREKNIEIINNKFLIK